LKQDTLPSYFQHYPLKHHQRVKLIPARDGRGKQWWANCYL